jgi:hypothetical protein
MVAPAFKEASNVIPLLPAPDPSDSEDVVVALQTARALQRKGDLQDAVRWLRRAADAAGGDGNDRRALALARAAADLTTLIGTSAKAVAPPPPSPPSLPASSLPPPPPSNAQRAARTSALPPSSSLPPPLHKPAPPPLPEPPTPPAKRSGPPPLPKPAVGAAGRVAGPPPLPATPTDVPAKRPDAERRAPIDLTKLLSSGSVTRVSIKASVREPGLLVLRKLEPGTTLPPGRTEAYLVLADPGVDPFQPAAPKGKS